MHATLPLLLQTTFPAIRRRRLDTLQVNLGYKCNQSCVHCHVNAGPTRTEMMAREIADEVLAANQVEVIGSMPCYLQDNVHRQRGGGVFQSSIRALRKLNAEGYGEPA